MMRPFVPLSLVLASVSLCAPVARAEAVAPDDAGAAAASPVITLSSTEVDFVVEEGHDPGDQKVKLTNTGTSKLFWQAFDDALWLSVSPLDGRLDPGASKDMKLQVTSHDLSPGQYTATVTVIGNADNSPQTITVKLTVTPHPAIGLSTSSLTFQAVQGTDPADASFRITNAGGGTLNWSAGDDQAWLELTPTSGSLGPGAWQTIAVSVRSAGLQPGDYSATITVKGNASNSPGTIAVSLSVIGQPIIQVAPASLTFGVEQGNDPADQAVTIGNSGASTLAWSAETDASWLSVAPLAGSLSSTESQDLTVSVAAAGLAPGDYTATITVSGNATNSPQTVAVTLTVTQGPALGLSSETLSFGVQEDSDPADQAVTVTNTGGGSLTWSASGDAAWLALTPASGTLGAGESQDVTISVASADLAPGDYTGDLTFDGNATNAPQTITVGLTVTERPKIGLSTDALTFAVEEGKDPADQTLSVTNTGGGTLIWDAAGDSAWLSVAPASGSLAAGVSQDLTVSATSAELATGDHGATLTIAGNGKNAPQVVSVSLTVTQRPVIGLSTSDLTFAVDEGSGPSDQAVTVTNSGGGMLDWTASADAPWLSAKPASGSLAAGTAEDVTVTASAEGLAPGGYAATLTLSGNAGVAPQAIDVSLGVRLTASTDDLVQALAGGGSLNPGQIQYLDAMGNENGEFDLGDFLAWLESRSSSAAAAPDVKIRGASAPGGDRP